MASGPAVPVGWQPAQAPPTAAARARTATIKEDRRRRRTACWRRPGPLRVDGIAGGTDALVLPGDLVTNAADRLPLALQGEEIYLRSAGTRRACFEVLQAGHNDISSPGISGQSWGLVTAVTLSPEIPIEALELALIVG